MSIRRINITELLVNNVRIIPSRLVIDYRYINSSIDESKLAKISVLVTVVNGNPINICNMMDLVKPTESEYGIGKFTTGVIALPTDKVATGIYIDIYNAEYVSINRISISQLQSGTQPNGSTAISPDVLRIDNFTINDGSIFSGGQTVVLNNTCIGTPTHYRASRYSDFSDTIWATYSPNPLFELYTIGVNRIYLQVKNDISISESVYREVAWHGYEELVVTEVFDISDITISESISIVKGINEKLLSINESFTLESIDVSEEFNYFI